MPQPKDDEELRKQSGVGPAKAPEHPPAPPATHAAAEPAKPEEPKEPEERVLNKADAKNLLHGGHKLKAKGDPQTKWVGLTQMGGHLVLCQAFDEKAEEEILKKDLVLVE